MRRVGRSIASGAAGLALGLGVIASGGAAGAAEPANEPSQSWTYYGTYTSEFNCNAMGFLLREWDVANETMCQFQPGHQHVWKLYYR
jgi:hypothetical protein